MAEVSLAPSVCVCVRQTKRREGTDSEVVTSQPQVPGILFALCNLRIPTAGQSRALVQIQNHLGQNIKNGRK